jgi:predicted  nucleic acid-binding Zn-ribbon protein
MMARIGRVGVIAAVLLAGAAQLAGQSTPPARQTEGDGQVLGALLVEVRGLRAAMEQMASAGPRVQLLAARLQLQETRINNMIRRLDTVRDSLAPAQQELASADDQLKRLEEKLASSTLGADSQERMELTHIVPITKRQAADLRAKVFRLSTEESQLAADIAAEQTRWTAINQQLDELERALAKR